MIVGTRPVWLGISWFVMAGCSGTDTPHDPTASTSGMFDTTEAGPSSTDMSGPPVVVPDVSADPTSSTTDTPPTETPTAGDVSSSTGSTFGPPDTGSGSSRGSEPWTDSSETRGAGGSEEQVAGDRCTFVVDHAQSSAIGTVTIVDWSTDLPMASNARIDFGPAGAGFTMSAPVDRVDDRTRTLLLGMKAARDYEFRIVASSSTNTCTSPTFEATTEPLPEHIPVITKSTEESGGAVGFFVTTPGIRQGSARGLPGAYVFDSDGDVVWWTPESVEHISAAKLSWDGQSLWYVNANGGPLYVTSMDGLQTEVVPDLTAHHDLAALPEGGVATFAIRGGTQFLVEVDDDRSLREIVALPDLYAIPSDSYHPNALRYHPSDETFTLSDLNLDGFVKISRDGELIWQLGGEDPRGDAFDLVQLDRWSGNHGHDLGPDGRFVFYNNFADGGGSRIVELLLDENAWTATLAWEYEIGFRSQYLGDTQRLPNGNTAVVHSMAGVIYEVAPSGAIVQSFDNSYSFAHDEPNQLALFGYATFRPTLYGPPTSTWPEAER